MSALDDHLVDTYLEQLRRELQASPEEEQEILCEIRSHLWYAAQHHSEEGRQASPEILEQFGDAREIGQELRQVHGRATWGETILAGLPLLLLAGSPALPQAGAWIAPLLIAGPLAGLAIWAALRHTSWPLWGWAWLGCLPLVIPNAPPNPLWGALAYLVVLLLMRRRNWLEATLALYPLPTVWAFQRTALASVEVQNVGWSTTALLGLGLGMAVGWIALLTRTMRTPSGRARTMRALEGQGALVFLNALTVVAARLWPTYPSPYPFTLRYFGLVTLPYALYNGLPYLLFMVLTSLPAISALIRDRVQHRQPPSRPVVSG